MDSIQHLIQGFSIATTLDNLFYCLAGAIVGTLIGVLPGIGPIAGIALLIPATFGLNHTSAIVMLAGIYYGAMYGGSTTSILLNVPGETASVITCLDGYRMAQKGRAGRALAICAIGSFVGRTLRICGLVFLAPPLAEAALAFGPPGVLRLDGLWVHLAEQCNRWIADQIPYDGSSGAHHRLHWDGPSYRYPSVFFWVKFSVGWSGIYIYQLMYMG